MPLVWAHAEHLKLRRSLIDGKLFDLPPQTVKRYLRDETTSPRMVWRFNHKLRSIPTNKILRIETLTAAVIHWSSDGWQTVHDCRTSDTSLGIHSVDLSTEQIGTDIRTLCSRSSGSTQSGGKERISKFGLASQASSLVEQQTSLAHK